MTMDDVQKQMDLNATVKYHGEEYRIVAINKLNNTVTIAQGPIGTDVKVSELDE